ncbi:MAG: hypothetical protein AB7N65_11425 [Vicinamibacterales bacterium]
MATWSSSRRPQRAEAWTRLALVALVLLAPACGRSSPADPAGAPAPAPGDGWSPPRTPWGDPDLQGQWNNQSSTPLERPTEGPLAGRETITEEEAEELYQAERQSFDEAPKAGDPGTYNAFWRDDGKALTRTSLIVDPPDGRIPPYTAAAAARLTAARAERAKRGRADSYTDLPAWTRCISRGWNGIGSWYSSNYQIFQSPGYVVIYQELIHEPRIIPVDGRPHLPARARQWLGDSRGRWEGNTLVVETTNFDPKASFRGSGPAMTLIERYTPTDANTIDYQFTINDPETFTRPWTVSLPMRRQTDGITIYEYACHEGNHAMEGILGGARAEERQAAARGARR